MDMYTFQKLKDDLYTLMDCMTLIKHFWFKQQKSNLEYPSKSEMNWNITSWSTEWPRGWRAEEELATPDHSAPQVSLHHPPWVLAVAFRCFNPLVTLVEIHFRERASLGCIPHPWLPEDKGLHLHSHKECAKGETGDPTK